MLCFEWYRGGVCVCVCVSVSVKDTSGGRCRYDEGIEGSQFKCGEDAVTPIDFLLVRPLGEKQVVMHLSV